MASQNVENAFYMQYHMPIKEANSKCNKKVMTVIEIDSTIERRWTTLL